MENQLFIIGAGPGDGSWLLPAAKEKIDAAGYVFADSRYLQLIEHDRKEAFGSILQMPERIREKRKTCSVAVLVSGDALFYSLAGMLIRAFGREQVELIPGIGSLQYLAAKCGRTLEQARLYSGHGRTVSEADLFMAIEEGRDVYILCDKEHGPDWLAGLLYAHGYGELPMAAGSRLSYAGEQILQAPAAALAGISYDPLSVAAVFASDRTAAGTACAAANALGTGAPAAAGTIGAGGEAVGAAIVTIATDAAGAAAGADGDAIGADIAAIAADTAGTAAGAADAADTAGTVNTAGTAAGADGAAVGAGIVTGAARFSADAVDTTGGQPSAANMPSPHTVLLEDSDFCRGKTPMTREEVRWVIIGKLHLKAGDILWDIGAGTGSISCECARLLDAFGGGRVYSVERDPQAVSLLHQNRRKLGLKNMEIIFADAADAIRGLPVPDAVFIGGSGKELENLLTCIGSLKADIRVVTAAVTMETGSAAWKAYQKPWFGQADILQLQVGKIRQLGQYHMMENAHAVTLYCADTQKWKEPKADSEVTK